MIDSYVKKKKKKKKMMMMMKAGDKTVKFKHRSLYAQFTVRQMRLSIVCAFCVYAIELCVSLV